MLINATHLGERLNGIGTYILNLLTAWAGMPTGLEFDVYLHERARLHLQRLSFPAHFHLRWVGERFFSDTDNVRRILFSNAVAALRRREVIFNPSQLEMTFWGARQIVTVLDVIPLQVEGRSLRNQRLFFRFAVPRGIARSELVITPSEASREALRSRYGVPAEKIRVIPFGVRCLEPRGDGAVARRRRKYVLYAGRWAAHRNLDRLVEAFLRIADRVEHDLVLAGEPAPDWKLPSDGRVAALGYVSDQELAQLYRGASAFVFPSLAEGFGLPPVEAMACGCPVVASRQAGVAEACGSAALLVDARSVESIAAGILSVLQDEDLRARLIRAGHDRAAELTWERCAAEHLRLFEEVARA